MNKIRGRCQYHIKFIVKYLRSFSQSMASRELDECLYGFKSEIFFDVLYKKAESIYPKDMEACIWNTRVPEILDMLYESMDKNDQTVATILFCQKNSSKNYI